MPEVAASFVAGGIAGVLSTCITNPFDVLRVRLCASRSATGNESKSLLSHTRHLFSSGILRGMTHGLGPNLAGSIPSNAVYLSTYHHLKKLTVAHFGEESNLTAGLSAAGAVAMTNTTLAPVFTVRTRVQIDDSLTMQQCIADIWKRDGLRGFYRGLMTNMSGRFVEEVSFWLLFEWAKRSIAQGDFGNSFFSDSASVIGISAGAKVISTAISFPYQVIMTHLREVDKVTGVHHHTHIAPTIQYVYRQDGVRGFYKGLAPHMMRSVISKSTQVYTFNCGMLLYMLGTGQHSSQAKPAAA